MPPIRPAKVTVESETTPSATSTAAMATAATAGVASGATRVERVGEPRRDRDRQGGSVE